MIVGYSTQHFHIQTVEDKSSTLFFRKTCVDFNQYQIIPEGLTEPASPLKISFHSIFLQHPVIINISTWKIWHVHVVILHIYGGEEDHMNAPLN